MGRVRLGNAGADANGVRVFFRSFTSQTTAALTYHLNSGGAPLDGYLQTAGPSPIDLPGTQNGGTEWLTFPFFCADRMAPPSSQTDPDNRKDIKATVGYKIFGALIDNNLDDPYLTATPVSGGSALSLPNLLMGEHQCLVAQISYAGAPIPDGANPATSDKLSQRNLAISAVANPGLRDSRTALHTFEIEATPQPITPQLRPDELLLEWSRNVPAGTYLRIHIPSWNAADVVALADRLYGYHEIRVVDGHTLEVPGGGTRYVPIPRSLTRQTGVISIDLPLGIRKGQRFDLSVQQVTNRGRALDIPPPRLQSITAEQARAYFTQLASTPRGGTPEKLPRGAFDLGKNQVLITNAAAFDGTGDQFYVVEHPDPSAVARAQKNVTHWREPIGAFRIGIPVSTKRDMLMYQLQLLSIMSWRLEHLDRRSRWYPTMTQYVGQLRDKVWALGGNPYSVPPTPGGNIPQLHGDDDDHLEHEHDHDYDYDHHRDDDRKHQRHDKD